MRSITFQGDTSVRQIPGRLARGLALLICLFVSAVASAQVPTIDPSGFLINPVKPPIPPVSIPVSNPPNIKFDGPFTRIPDLAKSLIPSAVNTTRVITLEEAQQAAASDNPMARLGALQVEAAKQNRQTFAAAFFPQVSAAAGTLHFNQFMVRRPLPVIVPLLGQDTTTGAFNVMQPLTPLLKVQQAVKIARADENIARVKAGMAVASTANEVEESYFALLIAQRELVIARSRSKSVQAQYLVASNSPTVHLSTQQQAELIEAEKATIVADSKVRELSASLNSLIGFPEETELQLVPPTLQVAAVSLAEATQAAMTSNPEVVEAEQTAIKARAGRRLAKLDYVPDVVALGGYANQDLIPVLPQDFAYVGVMATYTLFDGFKREHTVKMRDAQVEAAELALVLTKAKVAASVKTSYFDMDRLRSMSQLSRRMISTSEVVNASYQAGSSELQEARARMEVEMFRAELDYRAAYARLKTLMGNR